METGIRRRFLTGTSFVRIAGLVIGLNIATACANGDEVAAPTCTPQSGIVQIAGQKVTIGSESAYPEEGPAQEIEFATFWIDRTEVTVAQFAKFVEQTNYDTLAERPVDPKNLPDVPMTAEQRAHFLAPGGAVFDPSQSETPRQLRWWVYVPGANWKYPQGPQMPAAKDNDPVTQIALEDALAYARWAGGRLPTEAEWEAAASLGASKGANSQTSAPQNANTWQGAFPVLDEGKDGFEGVAPVGCFAPDRLGLYDMLGNVWEWTSDPYNPRRQSPDVIEPFGAGTGASLREAAIKGGSYLCAPNYCMRYRPSARQAQETGLGTNHIGFRLVYDSDPKAAD